MLGEFYYRIQIVMIGSGASLVTYCSLRHNYCLPHFAHHCFVTAFQPLLLIFAVSPFSVFHSSH